MDQLINSMASKPTEKLEEKIAKSFEHKEEGNKFFKEGNIPQAFFHYHSAVLNVKGVSGASEEQKKRINEVSVSVYNNLAALYIKKEKWDKVLTSTHEVLHIDKNNVKALYRRGKARLATGSIDKAEEDFKKAASLDPKDKAIQNELAIIKKKNAESESKAKSFYAGMFKKMSEEKGEETEGKKEEKEEPRVVEVADDEKDH
eukprot:TRINITY_DN15056_c0_g1_i1.p2 TRINITY_DN15056_c0_g1~~TRINITY_DN15056_c0_g1_i1.p2  ORF type:complete len:202 (+),score=103.23 TRINITY_DN15056_c0_g1_i1:150-755(+)